MIAAGLALASACLLGTALVLTQFGLRHLTPLRGACVSIPTATVLFVAFGLARLDFSAWNSRSALIFALVGCIFPAGATLLTFPANRLIGPTATGALGNLAPVFAVGGAMILLREAPYPAQALALALVVAGVAILFGAPRATGVAVWALGLPIMAALLRGIAQPAVKAGLETWPEPLAATFIGYIVASSVVLTAGAIGNRGRIWQWSPRGWFWFALVGLCNGGASLLMYAALARSSVALVAPLIASYPLFTLALSLILRGRSADLSPRHALGAAVTVAGVVLLLI